MDIGGYRAAKRVEQPLKLLMFRSYSGKEQNAGDSFRMPLAKSVPPDFEKSNLKFAGRKLLGLKILRSGKIAKKYFSAHQLDWFFQQFLMSFSW